MARDKYDYLIIGGGIAGVMAAETVRSEDPKAEIGIISNETEILYSRVLLPSYLKKRIPREKVFLRSMDDFLEKKIDLRIGEEAGFVDTTKQEVALSSGTILSYKKLLIASGGRVNGTQDFGGENFYRLQTLADADKLFKNLADIKQPIAVGGSFISLEFLEIFYLNNLETELLVSSPHFFSKIFSGIGGQIMHDNFLKHKIKPVYNDSLKSVERKENSLVVTTAGLREISADAVALGIGIERNMDFLKNSGISQGETGILCNEFLETSADNVFTAGDVAEFYDVTVGKKRALGNWTNAILQGKRAGLNMFGKKEPFRHVSSYAITNLGLQITVLGDCEESHEIIIRQNSLQNQYEELFLREGVLVGASLINRFQDKSHLAALIESKTPIESYKNMLYSLEFDIKNITIVG